MQGLTNTKSWWDDFHNKIDGVKNALTYMEDSVLPHTEEALAYIRQHIVEPTEGDMAHALAMEADNLIARILKISADAFGDDVHTLGALRDGLIADAQVIRDEMQRAAVATSQAGKSSKAGEKTKESPALAQARERCKAASQRLGEIFATNE